MACADRARAPYAPGCYELGLKWDGRKSPFWVYLGVAKNLYFRMDQYSTNGSHLRALIQWHVKKLKYQIFVRFLDCKNEALAKSFEQRALLADEYPWNVRHNGKSWLGLVLPKNNMDKKSISALMPTFRSLVTHLKIAGRKGKRLDERLLLWDHKRRRFESIANLLAE